MSKLTYKDSIQEAIIKLAEGNPGAVTVCVELLKRGALIDPGTSGLYDLIFLDQFEIYSHRIWMLYKDVCDHNLLYFMAMIRARSAGIISQFELDHAIDNRGEGIDLDSIVTQVQEHFPKFAPLDVQMSEGYQGSS